ncbi:MAG: alpha-glucosidase/alpha-galactosidase [Kiritimatiellae bacterium]|jgi:alpha-galactosidase|nr:alpha-glucosidase/alpha-galactosidase [Kiritimatiellia bacterium]
MAKIVFIGAGSGFGAKSFVDIMSFPELHDSEIVLVDINPKNLDPVVAYCQKIVDHYNAPTKIIPAADWRDGVLDGADFVITSFAQGGPAYQGVPYHYEMSIPQEYGIYQNVGDTAGIAGVFRTLRTAGEMVAIGKDMEKRCPGAYLLNYVNPMSMLTRIVSLACPDIHTIGLCHNIQYSLRDIAKWLGVSHKELQYTAAGINHMDWFLRLEYLDGRNAYPDLMKASENPDIYACFPTQFELLKSFGYFTTESSGHCAEYLPYFMPRKESREIMHLSESKTTADIPESASRWSGNSELMKQLAGTLPLELNRSFEYGIHIIHALQTDNVYRMNINVMNNGLITNLPDDYCVEVCCTADRTGIHPTQVGNLPVPLAALCRGMADMQTLASDAYLEHDLNKAKMACIIDPLTAACATPAKISECFDKVLEADKPWLQDWLDGK